MTPADFKAARLELGHTQKSLAAELGVDPSTLRRWEMNPSVKSSSRPNRFAVRIVEEALQKQRRKIEKEKL